jgi:hypothetical protein
MKAEKTKSYPSIQDSVPFSGIFSSEEIQMGHKLFLERIQDDKKQALKKAAQISKATKLGNGIIVSQLDQLPQWLLNKYPIIEKLSMAYQKLRGIQSS